MLQTEAIAQFRQTLRGQLIEPEDPRYEECRQVYNAMISRKPRLIAQCADAADVMTSVRFARTHGVCVSIRGGGHNACGLGVCDDGVVIDLSPMRFVHVDAGSQTIRVGGGSTWGDVDHAAHAFGLAVPSGIISTTGVGGLTLGGGMGHLTRQYGLTIDNLLSADVVLADGECVVADATHNTDLFWALRGGGGNFGVVTSFLFQGRPVETVCAGPMLWDIEQGPEVMSWYRGFIPNAPEELNGFFLFMTVPPGPPFPQHLHFRKMCGVVWCYTGGLEMAAKLLEPVRRAHPPLFEFFGEMPFPMLQSMFDGLYPKGHYWYWKADFFKEISDAAIEQHMKHARQMPTMQSSMHLYPVNGAAHRVKNEETAWGHRDAVWSQVIVGVDPDPKKTDEITGWAKAYWEDTHPYGSGGAYVNFMMEEGDERVRATYGGNYTRLAAVKAKYDPENFFRVNQNIRPAAAAAKSS